MGTLLARITHEPRLPQMQGAVLSRAGGIASLEDRSLTARLRLEAKMNWPQIRQGRMVLKGTQFPILQPQSKCYRHF
jgi:hypothetical protein